MNETLIKEYIDRQSLIAAIERFSEKYDLKQFEAGQKKYQELIPKTTPGPGQQYAFEVDLDKCTGCKACVTACHNENGLDEDETWRSVGLIQGGTSENPRIQHVTTACHHCLEPACMKGCPTKAYEKDEATGIVKHLDDQCFGCQYCILKCPYDVPKYNKKRGIVHKCDMCIGRLTAGQAPACARACPTGAIRITIVDKQDVQQNTAEYVKIPDAPASEYTLPTTKYKTKRILPSNMESTDYYTLKPEHSHLPLVVMLILTQLSVGIFFASFLLKQWINPHFEEALSTFHVPFALSVGIVAITASLFHLGRPWLFFRAILGVQTSWLSREIITFSGFAGLAMLYAIQFSTVNLLAMAVVVMGMLGIFCSAMVYRDTKRPFWDTHLTTIKFFLTALILGCAGMLLTSILWALIHSGISAAYMVQYLGLQFCRILAITMGIKLLLEASIFFSLNQGDLSFLKKTALLMSRHLRKFTLARFGYGFLGGILLPVIFLGIREMINPPVAAVFVSLIFGATLVGEFFERYLFFRAVVPLKMPGAMG